MGLDFAKHVRAAHSKRSVCKMEDDDSLLVRLVLKSEPDMAVTLLPVRPAVWPLAVMSAVHLLCETKCNFAGGVQFWKIQYISENSYFIRQSE